MSGPSTPILDPATGHSDLDPLIAGWGSPTFSGESEWIYFDNALAPNGGTASAYWDAEQFGPDSEVYYTISNFQHIGDIRLLLRIEGVGGANDAATTFYYIARLTLDTGGETGGTFIPTIGKNVGGAGTTLSTGSTFAMNPGDRALFRSLRSQLSLWHKPLGSEWVQIMTVGDTELTQGGFIGIYSDSTAARFVDFGGGVAGTVLTPASVLPTTRRG